MVQNVVGAHPEAQVVFALDLFLLLLRSRFALGFGRFWIGWGRWRRRLFRQLRPEVEASVNSEVGDKQSRTLAIVDGDDLLTWERRSIEVAPPCFVDTGARQVGGEGGAVVKLSIAVEVLAHNDVERAAGLVDDEGVDAEVSRDLHEPAQEHTAANIVRGSTVILMKVIGVRGKASWAGSIGIHLAQHVKAEKTRVFSVQVAIHDKPIAARRAFRVVFVDIFVDPEWPRSAGGVSRIVGARERRVDVAGEKEMLSA